MSVHVKPGYILVDLDHTLGHYTTHKEQGLNIGDPIPAMVERIKRWLKDGEDVRIFTARASRADFKGSDEEKMIQEWCESVFGHPLQIQNWKCFDCKAIWDNIAVTVEVNSGWRLTCEIGEGKMDPLSKNEEKDLCDIAYKRNNTQKR